MATVAKPSLRERKFAKTKLALLEAAVIELEHCSLEGVSVKALCDRVDVSEATFFNYFPKKTDLLDYYIQLWNLELSWVCQQSEVEGLALIDELFQRCARDFQKHTGMLTEIIAYLARQRSRVTAPELGLAERQKAFPKLVGIEEVEIQGLDRIWMSGLQQAVASGQLPKNTHIPTAIIGLAAIFYGVALMLCQSNAATIGSTYKQQLQIFWQGIISASGGR